MKTDLKRGPIKGLPDSALMECAFITGKRKSGKSVTQRLMMERSLTLGIRSGWIDGVGVGWGITVAADGKSPGFEVVVFGGEHGHLPINENSGKALGTTLAKAAFSWVLDLSKLPSKSARVRFMLDFVQALYENCEETLLLFMDEVDLWAPQNILDKQGPSAQLLGAMHELVRRGRIKGLNIWMATQRPAEVSKGIISQAECMLTFKLVAPQDLNAATDWMQAHVAGDKTKINVWKSEIPGLNLGQAMVYLTEPKVSIETVQFPPMLTLDTFRPPKRGETAHSGKGMAKVDLGKIKEVLGAVEAELTANDPVVLKRRISELEREIKTISKAPAAINVAEIEHRGYTRGFSDGMENVRTELRTFANQMHKNVALLSRSIDDNAGFCELNTRKDAPVRMTTTPPMHTMKPATARALEAIGGGAAKTIRQAVAMAAAEGITRPQQRVIDAIAWWGLAGNDAPTRPQIAGVAGYSPSSGGFNNLIGQMNTSGLVYIPAPGTVSLTDSGRAAAQHQGQPTTGDLHARLEKVLSAPQWKVLSAAIRNWNRDLSREELGAESGYSATSGGFNNLVGELCTLEMLVKPRAGFVKAADWLFL